MVLLVVVLMHAYNPRAQDAETARLWVSGQPQVKNLVLPLFLFIEPVYIANDII
jgi:hypothetical protein